MITGKLIDPVDDQKRVLLVDDEIDLCESLKDVLEDRGYTVDICGTIVSGFAALGKHGHTVAIVDLRLGQESGLDFIGSGALGAPDTTFIMMTAFASTETAVEALRRGAHDYIEKPVDIERLTNLIGRCFEQQTLRQEKLAAELALKAVNEELEERVSQRTQDLEQEIQSHLVTEAQLIDSMEKAKRANAAKSAFLSSVSHELRTPLNAIMGFAQVLQISARGKLDARQLENIQQIVENGDKLTDLIEQILDLSKLEKNTSNIDIAHVAIDDIIHECIDHYIKDAENHGLSLSAIVDSCQGIMVAADRSYLKQALLNLMSNAIKYNRDGGAVTVSCDIVPSEHLKISVVDTGFGIPSAQHKNVFQPFQRLGREGTTIEGAGVGLSISKNLVELMGGRIGFNSEHNVGSTFWIDIPVAAPAAAV